MPAPAFNGFSAIGEAAVYAGLRGSTDPTQEVPWPTYSSAQHPVYPVTISLNESRQVIVGGANQRCLLPAATGGVSYPYWFEGPLPEYTPSYQVYERFDRLYAQTTYTPPSTVTATFTWVTGAVTGYPPLAPDTTSSWAVVAQILVPAELTEPSAVQILLPSIIGGGVETSLTSNDGAPASIAVNVVGPPYYAPYLQGNLAQLSLPAEDAGLAINAALAAVGPGGAIYIPSGIYGIKTTITTVSATAGDLGGSNYIGQTIIFGGDVTFIALGNYQAFQFGPATTTIGEFKCYDPGVQYGDQTEAISLSGPGSTYPLSLSVDPPSGTTTIIIQDSDGNTAWGTYTPPSGTTPPYLTSLGELNQGQFQSGTDYGVIAANAAVTVPLTSGDTYAVQIIGVGSGSDAEAGEALTIDSIVTSGWANGVLISSMKDSDIRQIRCINVQNVGVQITSTQSSTTDSHIGSIYCNTQGGGGVCGLLVYGSANGNKLSALKFDHVETLGFSGPLGLDYLSPNQPHGAESICATGVMICSEIDSPHFVNTLMFSKIFASSCANGVMIGAGVFKISIADYAGDPGDGSTESAPPGYVFALCGGSAHPIFDIWVGHIAGYLGLPGANYSCNGIYMTNTQYCHIDLAGIAYRNQDGVYFDSGCSDIGIDHLILVDNGQNPGGTTCYGVNGAGSPSLISIDKLDGSGEKAAGGVINVGAFTNLSFNDLSAQDAHGTPPAAFGYYTSGGAGFSTPGFTAGQPGNATPAAYQIGNTTASNGLSQLGADSAHAVHSVNGDVLLVSNGSGDYLLALNAAGTLSALGGMAIAGGVTISSGAGNPSGTAQVGSIYANNTSTTIGQTLWVFGPSGWTAFA